MRAPTPTAAAELAVPVLTDEILKIDEYSQRLTRTFQAKLQYLSSQLSKISQSVIFKQPERLYDGYLQNVDQLENRLLQEMDLILRNKQQTVDLLNQRLKGYPVKQMIKEQQVTVKHLQGDLVQEMEDYLQKKNFRLEQAMQALEHLSPLKILARGYAVVETEENITRSIADVELGDRVQVTLNDGNFEATVEEINEKKEQTDG